MVKSDYFNTFTNDYKDYQKFLTNKKFNAWVQKYSTYKNYEYKEGNTNGSRWFLIETKDFKENDNDFIF